MAAAVWRRSLSGWRDTHHRRRLAHGDRNRTRGLHRDVAHRRMGAARAHRRSEHTRQQLPRCRGKAARWTDHRGSAAGAGGVGRGAVARLSGGPLRFSHDVAARGADPRAAPGVVDPARRDRRRAADRLCECRESAAGARGRPTERDRRAHGARCGPLAHRAATGYRDVASRSGWRGDRPRSGGSAAAALCAGGTGQFSAPDCDRPRCARAGLFAGRRNRHRLARRRAPGHSRRAASPPTRCARDRAAGRVDGRASSAAPSSSARSRWPSCSWRRPASPFAAFNN